MLIRVSALLHDDTKQYYLCADDLAKDVWTYNVHVYYKYTCISTKFPGHFLYLKYMHVVHVYRVRYINHNYTVYVN